MRKLVETFKKYGIELSKIQENQFDKYFSMLIETNKVLNLTAITEENEVLIKHFLDSAIPEKFIPKNSKVIDIGSGAGFPALPLKIVREDLEVTMVDSLNKRVKFLEEVTKELNLQKTFAIHSRAEDFAKENHEKYDVAVARAVASLDTLVEYLLPFVKIDGIAIIYKSTKLEEELENAQKAISTLGGKVEKIEKFEIFEENLQRNILILKKITKTPPKYPRGKNQPKTNPIK